MSVGFTPHLGPREKSNRAQASAVTWSTSRTTTLRQSSPPSSAIRGASSRLPCDSTIIAVFVLVFSINEPSAGVTRVDPAIVARPVRAACASCSPSRLQAPSRASLPPPSRPVIIEPPSLILTLLPVLYVDAIAFALLTWVYVSFLLESYPHGCPSGLPLLHDETTHSSIILGVPLGIKDQLVPTGAQIARVGGRASSRAEVEVRTRASWRVTRSDRGGP
ncbi:hypothetical protein E5676_scaffold237G001270 [Cucumis melo var. makuwa]|uniref:Uncharacterized protein n=1 Tax=Cucumis melo var. makuwa TaxID=1194695 RepID=A0A5D3DAU1_CUCMM|nr:hypothetical protein E5676_scaffold237G001270 [Cucumis melo var. makuwa]